MDQYMTSMEISDRWGADPRTIQNLCRNGKIHGAIKRAGSWFIPKDTPNLLKNNKSNGERFNFVGTKKKVFDAAIELFSTNGYEPVSLRDIGDLVDITQSTIYNHFASKQALLDTIYDYYTEHFHDNLRPLEEMKEILTTATSESLCLALMFTFESSDGEKYKRMILTTKIIYMRLYQDDRARDIFLHLMNANMEDYVQEILEYGVSIGVWEEFDIPTYAKFLTGLRHIMGMKAFASPDYKPQQLEEEERIIRMCANMLPLRQ